jgi:hypothetical protein
MISLGEKSFRRERLEGFMGSERYLDIPGNGDYDLISNLKEKIFPNWKSMLVKEPGLIVRKTEKT